MYVKLLYVKFVCVKLLSVCGRRRAAGGGGGGRGEARDTESKTRTPHKDVGKYIGSPENIMRNTTIYSILEICFGIFLGGSYCHIYFMVVNGEFMAVLNVLSGKNYGDRSCFFFKCIQHNNLRTDGFA